MKKLLSILILLCISLPAFAEIEPPRWEEFCPQGYCYAEPDNYRPMNGLVRTVTAMTIVGLPIVSYSNNRAAQANSNNYWSRRRVNFEQSVKSCKNFTDNYELNSCYFNIRQNELMLNQERNNYVMQIQQINQMRQLNNNVNSINRNINNVNNYIRYGY